MTPEFEQVGQITTGGAVLGIAEDAQGKLWVASPAGLFCRGEGGWQAQANAPLARAEGVLAAEETVWAYGDANTLIRSNNGGDSWQRCLIEQTDAEILCLLASPNYAHDRVLLAGTLGAGVLRSTNGGKQFELVNFGLESLTIFGLAAAPAWSKRYAYAFAVTGDAIFQSPNGGRGWRLAQVDEGLTDVQPIAVAASIDFDKDGTVFVGCAAGEVLISADKGHSFKLLTTVDQPISTLTCQPNGSLLVTLLDKGVIHLAADGTKQAEATTLDAALHLTITPSGMFIGTANGLLNSADNGHTWQPVPDFIARRFIWFITPAPSLWLAAGPDDGVWLSNNCGESWRLAWNDGTVLALAATDEQISLGTDVGLLASRDHGATWQAVFDQPISAIAAIDSTIWYGNENADLWHDGVAISTTFAGNSLLGLYANGNEIIAATWRADSRMTHLWQSQNSGQDWQLILAEKADRIVPQVAFEEAGLLVGIGRKLYQQTNSGWHTITASSPIVAIIQTDSHPFIVQSNCIAMLNKNVLVESTTSISNQFIADAAVQNESLYLCSTIGSVWQSSL